MATLGYETGFIQVEGIAGSETNAALIADYIANLGPDHHNRPLILVGYSKGLPDIFAFLVGYPELTHIPGAECEKKDSTALETLSPANREAWFAEHTLPEHIRYYSVVAFPNPDTTALSPATRRTQGCPQ